MTVLNLIYTNTAGLRSTLRTLGLTRVAAQSLGVLGLRRGYEEAVDRRLASAIRPGDCVWDVGANVGLYTEKFAQAAGPSGSVVAFEPIDASRERVLTRVPAAIVRSEALGAASATVEVVLDEGPTSPMNSLLHQSGPGPRQTVRVARGDDLIREGLPSPTVLKVDTEGYEEDVLNGMRETLRTPALRAVMIEVHFGLLETRGYRRAPGRLASLLEDSGFRVEWVDASHLFGER